MRLSPSCCTFIWRTGFTLGLGTVVTLLMQLGSEAIAIRDTVRDSAKSVTRIEAALPTMAAKTDALASKVDSLDTREKVLERSAGLIWSDRP